MLNSKGDGETKVTFTNDAGEKEVYNVLVDRSQDLISAERVTN